MRLCFLALTHQDLAYPKIGCAGDVLKVCAQRAIHEAMGRDIQSSFTIFVMMFMAVHVAEGYTRRALLSEIHLRREAEGGGMEIVFNQQLPRLG